MCVPSNKQDLVQDLVQDRGRASVSDSWRAEPEIGRQPLHKVKGNFSPSHFGHVRLVSWPSEPAYGNLVKFW